MGIFFLVLSFVFIFLSFYFSFNKKEDVFLNFRVSFLKASLFLTASAVVFTEGLSFFGKLNMAYLFVLWLLVFFASLFFLIFCCIKRRFFWENSFLKEIIFFLKKESLFLKFLIFLSFITLAILARVALTANDNWDSYTYHLPKVEHWIQNENVNFFPTNNIRQLYLAPLAEYLILNLRLLSGNILFINFIQFFSLINCLLGISLIAKLFSLSKKGQIISFVLALAIPMGILQSATTQNDLVVSFFLVSFVYFSFFILKKKSFSFEDVFFLSLSFALGFLAKATFYVFVAPFVFLGGIYFFRIFKWKSFLIFSSLILSFIFFNFCFLKRNYDQFNSFLGPKKTASYYLSSLNDSFGLKETLSNFSRNIGLHLALPSEKWNGMIDRLIINGHQIIGISLNSPSTTWQGTQYKTVFCVHHDTVGNFLHLLLFIFSIILFFVFYKKNKSEVKLYFLSLLTGFLFFSFLLKWQPWQTRLDLPLFFLAVPFSVLMFSQIKMKLLLEFICGIFLLVAFSIVLFFNPTKPVLGERSFFLKNNNDYIFFYKDVLKLTSELNKKNVSNIGLVLGEDSAEWQYWILFKNKHFEHVYFHRDFLKTSNFKKDFYYKALIIDKSLIEKDLIKSVFLENYNVDEIIDINERAGLVILKNERNDAVSFE